MTDKDERPAQPPVHENGDGEDSGRDTPTAPGEDHRIAQLRTMGEDSDHLDDVIEEARDAVQAARRADSMRSAGAQGGDAEEEEGPQPSG